MNVKLDTWTKRVMAVVAGLTLTGMLMTGGATATVWLLDIPFVSEEELDAELGLWKEQLTGSYVKKEDLQYQFDMVRFDQREVRLLDSIKRINIKESLEPLTPTDKALRASWQSELLEVRQQKANYIQTHPQ